MVAVMVAAVALVVHVELVSFGHYISLHNIYIDSHHIPSASRMCAKIRMGSMNTPKMAQRSVPMNLIF